MSLGTHMALSQNQVKPCKTCGAAIAFKKTAAGKWYPVDTYTVDGESVMYQGPTGFTARHSCRTKGDLT
jgi:hypothetical protein